MIIKDTANLWLEPNASLSQDTNLLFSSDFLLSEWIINIEYPIHLKEIETEGPMELLENAFPSYNCRTEELCAHFSLHHHSTVVAVSCYDGQ